MKTFTLVDLKKTIDACRMPGDGVELTEHALDVSFDDLGFDSLSLLDVVTRLQDELKLRLSDSEVEAISTPRSLIDYVNGRLLTA